jgi:hypothetical protein
VKDFHQSGFARAAGISQQRAARRDFSSSTFCIAVSRSEFLVRTDLNHTLVRAYERAVCMVNSFRADIGQEGDVDLLTDESAAKFPVAERRARSRNSFRGRD